MNVPPRVRLVPRKKVNGQIKTFFFWSFLPKMRAKLICAHPNIVFASSVTLLWRRSWLTMFFYQPWLFTTDSSYGSWLVRTIVSPNGLALAQALRRASDPDNRNCAGVLRHVTDFCLVFTSSDEPSRGKQPVAGLFNFKYFYFLTELAVS